MVNNNLYSKNQIEKLGNAIIYLAEKIQPLSKTKLLKLIYLLEETAVKKYGVPFLGIDFQLWKLGPVAKDLFIELSSSPALLDNYIAVANNNDATFITAKQPFCDDEFSDMEMELMDIVVSTFRNYTAHDLINITHRENHPWHDAAKSSGYLEAFDKNQCNSTEIVLDLSSMLNELPEQKAFYLSTLAFQKQSNHLKGIA